MITVMSGSGSYGTITGVNFKLSLQWTSVRLMHQAFSNKKINILKLPCLGTYIYRRPCDCFYWLLEK